MATTIDTGKIEGYANMSAEEKVKVLESFVYEDNAAELEKLKSLNSKANSEAAEWKRKHNALLSEDEKRKQDSEEKWAQMEKELATLKREKAISDHIARFTTLGYDTKLAEEAATALADNDTQKMFTSMKKFLDGYTQKIEADIIKSTPRPASGELPEGNSEETTAIELARGIGRTSANSTATAESVLKYYTR